MANELVRIDQALIQGKIATVRGGVFWRFYRVDPARTAETGGAGLGLAIVRSIASLHGGDATLKSSRPSGCRFTIRLPRSVRS